MNNSKFIQGVGSKKPKIVFIQDCVPKWDYDNDEPFSDRIKDNWVSSLEKSGVLEEDLYFTYAVKYPVTKVNSFGRVEDSAPKDKDLLECKEVLMEELHRLNPDIIVPMGNMSLKALGLSPMINKLRGTASEKEINGRKYIIFPMLSFMSVKDIPKNKPLVIKDKKTLCGLFKNGLTQANQNHLWKVIDDFLEAEEELTRLNDLPDNSWIAFDLETSSLNPYDPNAHILCISISDRSKYGVSIPITHKNNPMNKEEQEKVKELVKILLENNRIRKFGHNVKFDCKWLRVVLGINVRRIEFDTNIAHYLAVSEEVGEQSLKTLAWMYTDVGGYDNVLDDYKKTHTINSYEDLPYDMLMTYASADADVTFRMFEMLEPMVNSNDKWKNIFNEILIPGIEMLLDVECNGILLNQDLMKFFITEYEGELLRYERELSSYPEVLTIEREKQAMYNKRQSLIKSVKPADRTDKENEFIKATSKYKDYKFNWRSTNQVQELLFKKLGLEPFGYTETGNPSTNEESLEMLALQHPLPKLLLGYKKVNTLTGMFIKTLPNLVDKENFIHPTFNITGTVTGRLSSKDPNVQQLPRTIVDVESFQFTHEIKRLFKSRFGKLGCILQFDYSSLELRCAAMISGDKEFTDIFKSGLDMHKATASRIFNIPFDDVTKDQRSHAKTVNFGILYGKSGRNLGLQIHPDWTPEQQKEFGENLIETWMKGFKSLGGWINKQKDLAKHRGYVETIFGRYRRLPDAKSRLNGKRNDALRQAVNSPIQGSGSDMTVASMIEINKWIKESNKTSKLICNVHDSIVLDCYLPELYEVASKVKYFMEHAHLKHIDTDVPIIADCEVGLNYGMMYETEVNELLPLSSPKSFNRFIAKKVQKKAVWALTEWKANGHTDEVIKRRLSQAGFTEFFTVEELYKLYEASLEEEKV